MNMDALLQEGMQRLNIRELEMLLRKSMLPPAVTEQWNLQEFLSGMLRGEMNFSKETLIKLLGTLAFAELRDILIFAAELACIGIVAGLLAAISGNEKKDSVSGAAEMLCSCFGAAVSLTAIFEIYRLCGSTIGLLSELMSAVLPLLLSLNVIGGGAAEGSALQVLLTGEISGISLILSSIIFPLVFLSSVLVILNSMGSQHFLQKLANFLRGGALFFTGLLITLFSGSAAIQGLMTKSADSILLKSARFSVDHLVPVVGGFTADSLEMLLSGLSVLRGGIGVLGVILLALMLLPPLLHIAGIVLVLRLSAVFLELTGSSRSSDCMQDLSKATEIFGALLLMVTVLYVIFFSVAIKAAPVI